jgi:hypothetical protein
MEISLVPCENNSKRKEDLIIELWRHSAGSVEEREGINERELILGSFCSLHYLFIYSTNIYWGRFSWDRRL